jgi:hypothetical protein
MNMTKTGLWQYSTWATKNAHCATSALSQYAGFSQIQSHIMYQSLDCFQWRFKVVIISSIDCPGVGCGTSTWRLNRFSGGEGGVDEVKGPGLLLPVGVGPGEWRVANSRRLGRWRMLSSPFSSTFTAPLWMMICCYSCRWVSQRWMFILCSILPAWDSRSPALHLLSISVNVLSLSELASRHWR